MPKLHTITNLQIFVIFQNLAFLAKVMPMTLSLSQYRIHTKRFLHLIVFVTQVHCYCFRLPYVHAGSQSEVWLRPIRQCSMRLIRLRPRFFVLEVLLEIAGTNDGKYLTAKH